MDYTHHNNKLMLSAIKRFCSGIIILGLFLFICSGDINYWNAWLYIIVLSVSMLSFGTYLYINDKEFLQKRLNTKEKEKEQNAYTFWAGLSFIATFGVCGLDYRFDWSNVSVAVVIIALIIMLAGYGFTVITLMQNRFASRVVEIQNNQKVIDTGVYAIVRHPMYTGAILMFFASPIVLGSYFAAIPMLFFLAAIIFRIKNEEKILREGLEGYENYLQRVKYRLIPFVW